MAQSPPLKRKKGRFKNPNIENYAVENKKCIKFFIIRRLETDDEGNHLDFKKVSPFFIHKTLKHAVGDLKVVKKLKDGTLFVEAFSDSQSEKLLKCEKLSNNFPIKVEPHKTLNLSKGIIWCPDLNFCSIEEIKDELKSQNVVEVKRMTYFKNNEKKDSHNYLITFDNPSLPNEIKIGFYNVVVRQFISNPTRCYICLKFGHTKTVCKKEPLCRYCGNIKHEGSECNNSLQCVNCSGKHDAFSKSCPVFVREKEIKGIQESDKITYIAAKKKI